MNALEHIRLYADTFYLALTRQRKCGYQHQEKNIYQLDEIDVGTLRRPRAHNRSPSRSFFVRVAQVYSKLPPKTVFRELIRLSTAQRFLNAAPACPPEYARLH